MAAKREEKQPFHSLRNEDDPRPRLPALGPMEIIRLVRVIESCSISDRHSVPRCWPTCMIECR